MRKNRLRLITAILFITIYMFSALAWWAFALTRNQEIIYQKELSLLELKRDWARDFAYHFSRSEAFKTSSNKTLMAFESEQIYVDTAALKRAVLEKFPEIHVYLVTLRQLYPLELRLVTDTTLKKNLELTRNSKKRAWILEGLTLGLITLLIAAAMFFYVDKIIRLNAQQNNFLLAVTHELKTPISATKLAIQTLQRNDSPNLVPKLMDMASSNILRLSRMVDQILLATKFESKFTDPVYAPVVLSVLFEHAIKGLELPPEKRALVTLIHEEEIEFEADENMMVIVIRNLITNAIKYGLDRPIEIKTEKFKLGFKIEVSDNGIGVSDSDKKLIFEKFYRVGEEKTRTQPGSGLGLYLVKNITEIHSGKVTVTDNTPNGTKFTLTFNQSQPLA